MKFRSDGDKTNLFDHALTFCIENQIVNGPCFIFSLGNLNERVRLRLSLWRKNIIRSDSLFLLGPRFVNKR